ncbi:MAG: heme exporter protein CcmB [Sphingobacteriales bacterium]|nr:heme exporter protein CcmB [Sphingobacteriales bacterium]
MLHEIWILLLKDFRLEWRQRYALNGLLLYVSSSVFLVYMAFLQMKATTWMTVLWIILLFAAANAVAKSFVQEHAARQLYYYTLLHPEAVIISKMVYNTLLLGTIAALGVSVYSLFLGFPVQQPWVFVAAIALGALSFSLTFTLVAAIAAKAGGNSSILMPILAFPIIIPLLSLLIALSTAAVSPETDLNYSKNLSILLAINVILFSLSFILFPYLWRD